MSAWIAVACAEHVRRGRSGGFMQVCHGTLAPLRRIKAGDHVATYSPTIAMGGKAPYRAFTALGRVAAGDPACVDMGGGFEAWRRAVDWFDTTDASIVPLLSRLSFSAGRRNWGQPLRFGLLKATDEEIRLVAAAMGQVVFDQL